jgi:ABC-type sugar transport system permease subunit
MVVETILDGFVKTVTAGIGLVLLYLLFFSPVLYFVYETDVRRKQYKYLGRDNYKYVIEDDKKYKTTRMWGYHVVRIYLFVIVASLIFAFFYLVGLVF